MNSLVDLRDEVDDRSAGSSRGERVFILSGDPKVNCSHSGCLTGQIDQRI